MIIRQIFRIYKKADRTTRLLPCETNTANADTDAIDHEDQIPSEEDRLRTWVYHPRMIRNRLCFSLKLSAVASIKHMRDSVYPWMAKNSSFVKMDDLKSNEVVGIDCIVEYHTQYYNRDQFKTYVIDQLKKRFYRWNEYVCSQCLVWSW